jgi:flagellar M-ring protein FliF
MSKGDYFKIAEILVLAIVALLVILLVLRPLVTRVFAGLADGAAQAMQAGNAISGPNRQLSAPANPIGSTSAQHQISAPDAQNAEVLAEAAEQSLQLPPSPPPPESLIDLDKVEGRVKASSVRKVGEIVDKHPEEALTILRGWMAENPH